MEKKLQLNSWLKANGYQLLREMLPLMGLAFVFVLFGTTNANFLKMRNLVLVFKQSIIVMIGAIGSTFVLAHGNQDFSIGGSMALTCLCGCLMAQKNPYLLLPTCLIVAVLISLLVAVVHVKIGVPAFLCTMCVMFIGKGINQSFCGYGISAPAMYAKLDKNWFYILTAVAIFTAALLVYQFTKVGRYNKMIGSNTKAAYLSGIDVGKYKMLAFLMSGIAVGLASFLTMIRSGGVAGQTGQTFEIDTIIVLILGGAPISGGSGVKLQSSIIGALLYYCLSNGLILWGVSADIIYILKGILFLAIVSLTFDRSNKY